MSILNRNAGRSRYVALFIVEFGYWVSCENARLHSDSRLALLSLPALLVILILYLGPKCVSRLRRMEGIGSVDTAAAEDFHTTIFHFRVFL